jgi:hypothetical protein
MASMGIAKTARAITATDMSKIRLELERLQTLAEGLSIHAVRKGADVSECINTGRSDGVTATVLDSNTRLDSGMEGMETHLDWTIEIQSFGKTSCV